MYPFTPPGFTLIIHLALAALVYQDSRLNARSGIGWAVLVFFFGIYGFIAYILFSRDTLKLAAERLQGKNLKEKLTSPSYKIEKIQPDRSNLSLPPEIQIQREVEVFIDSQLESLIDVGKHLEARKYLEGILGVAKESGNNETVEKYKKYEERLVELEESSSDWLINIQKIVK